MPRGYTIVWSGWEDLGTLDTFNASANFPIARFRPTAANPTGTITGPSYEYIVVGNATTASVALTYPAATLDKTKATLTHRVHLNDAPPDHSRIRLELQRGRNGNQPRGREFRGERHLRVRVHGQGPEGARPGLRRGAGLDGVPALRKARRLWQPQSAGPAHQARLHRDLVATRASSQRFPAPRVQRNRKREEGLRRPHAVDRRGQRHQHELSLLAVRAYRAQPPAASVHRRPVPVRERDDVRSDHPEDRQPLRQLPEDRHLPAGHGNLLGERILGEVRLAAAHDPGRHQGPAGFAVRPQLLHVEHAARHRQRRYRRRPEQRGMPAARQSAEFRAGAARAVHRAGRVGDEGQASRRRAACRG